MSRIKSISHPGWLVIGAVAALLVVPTAAAAVAVTSSVIIKGGTSAGQASVTGAHQLLTSEAGPNSFVNVFSAAMTCSAGGFYTVPSGKALIITAVTFYIGQSTARPTVENLFAGASATPCTTLVAGAISATPTAEHQVFQPGIAVAGGDSLGWNGANVNGSLQVYGYLVPAAAVAPAATHGPVPRSRGISWRLTR